MDWDIFLKSVAQLAIGVVVVTVLAAIIFVVIHTAREQWDEHK